MPYNSKDGKARIHIDYGIKQYQVWIHYTDKDIALAKEYDNYLSATLFVRTYNKQLSIVFY